METVMKDKCKFSVGLILLVTAVFITGFSFYKNEQITITTYVQEKEEIYDLYIRNFELQMQSIRTKLPETISLEDSPNIVKLLHNEKPLLVLRIKQTNCSMCIESAIDQLSQDTRFTPANSILLVSYSNLRMINLLLKKYDLHFYYLTIMPDELSDFPVERYESPYFFILYPNRELRHFFIPEKTYTEMTKEYLDGVISLIGTDIESESDK